MISKWLNAVARVSAEISIPGDREKLRGDHAVAETGELPKKFWRLSGREVEIYELRVRNRRPEIARFRRKHAIF